MSLHIVILAGGNGTRLWPLSRRVIPKHLLPIHPSGSTLLAATVRRVRLLGADISIVTTADQVEACAQALAFDQVDGDDIRYIVEPAARGTGPALGLAMASIVQRDPDAVICSVHADHYVDNDLAYCQSMQYAAGWAAARHGLATVGVTPTFASTGFGYIEVGDELSSTPALPGTLAPAKTLPTAYTALRFVEKPPLKDAEKYSADPRFLWNTGLFSWEASVFLDALKRADPIIHTAVVEAARLQQADETDAAAAIYAAVSAIAVDPLILERANNLTVIRGTFDWSDLGSWADLRTAWSTSDRMDADGNIVEGDVMIDDSRHCFVKSGGGRIVAVVGADDLVVIDTPDALLVLAADAAQHVKNIVDLLDTQARKQLL